MLTLRAMMAHLAAAFAVLNRTPFEEMRRNLPPTIARRARRAPARYVSDRPAGLSRALARKDDSGYRPHAWRP